MDKNDEFFKQILKEMELFLKDKKLFPELAKRSGVNIRTVYNTFRVESFEMLRGVRLNVYRQAIELIEEILLLPQKASNIFSSDKVENSSQNHK